MNTLRKHRVERQWWSAVLVPLAALTLLSTSAAVAAPSSWSPGVASPPGAAAVGADAEGDSTTVTLVTGDVVAVDDTGELPSVAVVDDAEPFGDIARLVVDEDVYAIPGVAVHLLATNQLDRELFNISRLIRDGYTDAQTDELPVIVTYEAESAERRALGSAAPEGSDRSRHLESVRGDVLRVDKSRAATFWADITEEAAPPEGGRSVTETLPGIDKVWLDAKLEVSLDRSRVTVGADRAWAAGYDGAGQTVAVLDTGIDSNHPDLAGQVVAERNFTDSDTAADRYGHGTHVASIITGTGTASEGRYAGVAPGAKLVNGKVCDDGGSCPSSAVIAGMEWAPTRAKVINMSLGEGPSDGTDLLSTALNEIAEQTGALFVVSAGNFNNAPQSVSGPAAADAAFAVAATTKTGQQVANFSSVGPRLGDGAIKPEISAPGSGIVAARADSDEYVGASGTSMAAPHVSASAAILLERYPDWTTQQLRDALTSTAGPIESYSVYWQGAGVVDVGTALTQDVHATGILDLGIAESPQRPGHTLEGDVTYTNAGDRPVTLDLVAEWWQAAGDFDGNDSSWTPPPGVVTISPSTVTVPAHGSAAATLSVETGAVPFRTFFGRLTGSSADGDVTVRTTVRFVREPQRHRLLMHATDRDGQPVTSTPPGGEGHISFGILQNLDTGVWSLVVFKDGEAVIGGAASGSPMPAGTYSFIGKLVTYGPEPWYPLLSLTMVAEPEFTVDRDRTFNFDARDAGQVEIRTQRPTTDGWMESVITRQAPVAGRTAIISGPLNGGSWASNTTEDEQFYTLSGGAATTGTFSFSIWSHRVAPPITLEVGGYTIQAEYARGRYRGVFSAQPSDPQTRFPARDRSTLVDVGTGTQEEIDAADVDGRYALLRPGPDWDRTPVDDEAQRLAEAGAKAVVVAPPHPGARIFVQDPATIPVAGLSYDEGLRVVGAVGTDRQPIGIDVTGNHPSPYSYDLVPTQERQLTNGASYHVGEDELGRADARYHDATVGETYSVLHAPDLRYYRDFASSQSGTDWVPGGSARTEYYSPDVPWRFRVSSSAHGRKDEGNWLDSGPRAPGAGVVFEPGDRVTYRFGSGPYVPGACDSVTGAPGSFLSTCGHFISSHLPNNDDLHVELALFTGPGPSRLHLDAQRRWYTADTQIICEPPECRRDTDGVYRVINDTRLAPVGDRRLFPVPPGFPVVGPPVPPQLRDVTLAQGRPSELSVRTHTEWTVNVDHDVEHQPGVLLDWSVDTGLDTVVPRSRPHVVAVTPLYGSKYSRQGGADHGPFTVRLSVTFDDGLTWEDVGEESGVDTGEAAGFEVSAPSLPQRINGFVGYRAVAIDQSGNAIDQTVIRAARTGTGLTEPTLSEPTAISFTERSATSGQYTDRSLFEARLIDSDGDPIADATVAFTLTGEDSESEFNTTTDEDGVATVTPRLEGRPGTRELRARYDGDDERAASADTMTFDIEKEDTDIELMVQGEGENKRIVARLSDLDTPTHGIPGRTIDFYSDNELLASAQTDGEGAASVALPPRHRGSNRTYETVFAADDFYLASSDNRPGKRSNDQNLWIAVG